jgi:hypothetical protein
VLDNNRALRRTYGFDPLTTLPADRCAGAGRE